MSARAWRIVAALVACLLLSGCPSLVDSPDDRAPDATAVPTRVLPALPTGASTGLPAYGGPPPGAPASVGPLVTLEAAVDLTPATPQVFARATSAVAAPGGGA